MSDRPPMLKRGERARLFPVLADTSKEKRVASILLAILPLLPEFAEQILSSVGLRLGKRTRLETFSEVVLQDDSSIGNRPDGLIVITSGKNTWTALVEAKIGKTELEVDQVARYLAAAKANGINAVITISNQFVARADQSPVAMPKAALKKVDLFHWSWTWLQTEAEIVNLQGGVQDLERAFVLSEFIRFLKDPGTGVERFTQMNGSWKDVVQSVTNHERLSKNAPQVGDTVQAWHSEMRDLSLQLSRMIGQTVRIRMDRRHLADSAERLKHGIELLTSENVLRCSFVVPDNAADIELTADLARKTIAVGMKIKAPQDRKTTKARLNWLLRMLKEDDDRLIIRAHWPGRKAATQKDLSTLRKTPEAIDGGDSALVAHLFEVVLIEASAKRFGGRRTFIEDIERVVPEFYHLVGQNLRAWQAPPPKPVQPSDEIIDEVLAEVSGRDSADRTGAALTSPAP